MYNPLKPSWGEPYDEIAGRMMAAVHDARDAARGHEAVIVSHQLPIWTTRLFLEKRSYLHHPQEPPVHAVLADRACVFDDDQLTQVRYSEPAGDLIPVGRPLRAVLRRRRPAGGPALKLLRLLLGLAPGLACLLALAGCSGLSGTGDKGYISGDGRPDGGRAGRPRRARSTSPAPTSTATTSTSPTCAASRSSSTSGGRGARRAGSSSPTSTTAAAELGDDVAVPRPQHP